MCVLRKTGNQLFVVLKTSCSFSYLRKTLYITIKRKDQQGMFLETSCFSMGISKIQVPSPLAQYSFSHRINTFGEKNFGSEYTRVLNILGF